jgi:tetratricopeptide (TPR) repeat protein
VVAGHRPQRGSRKALSDPRGAGEARGGQRDGSAGRGRGSPRGGDDRSAGNTPGRGARNPSGERRTSDARRETRSESSRASGAGANARAEDARRYPTVHLSDEVVKELNETARPGKGGILVEVFSRAAAAFAAGDFPEAIALGNQAKHIALRSPSVREFLGLALYRAQRWKEAAGELSTFRRLTGSQEQNPVIADSYRAMGRPERALELCGEIDRRRVPPAVHYEGVIVAAGALRDMGRLEDATRMLESLELDPEDPQEHHLRARYALADLLEQRGRFTQARKLFAQVAGDDPELTDAPLRTARLSRRTN